MKLLAFWLGILFISTNALAATKIGDLPTTETFVPAPSSSYAYYVVPGEEGQQITFTCRIKPKTGTEPTVTLRGAKNFSGESGANEMTKDVKQSTQTWTLKGNEGEIRVMSWGNRNYKFMCVKN